MKVYVSNYLSKSISIIDYDSLTLENEIKLDENIYPHHFCIDKETKKMYLPSSSNGILYILDMNSEKIIDSSSIGGSLSQIAMYKEEIFIANEDSNSIYFMDKNTLDPIGMISVDDMPHGFCFDLPRKKLYVPCMDSITCIDIINKVIEKKIDIDFKAWHVQLDKYKSEIYVSTLDGNVVIIDEELLNTKKVFDEFLLKYEELGYKFIFIPQLYGSANDEFLMKYYKKNDVYYYILSSNNTNYDTFFQQFLISKLYAVIGMRYHSNIFSAKEGTPFISISYEQKMFGFMQKIGLEEYCIDINELSIIELENKFKKLNSNYELYNQKLKLIHNFLLEESRKTSLITKRIIEDGR